MDAMSIARHLQLCIILGKDRYNPSLTMSGTFIFHTGVIQ